MPRPKTAPPPSSDKEADATSIARFCERHGISESFFHKLRAQGLGPTVMRVGARTLISAEAAADWRREREIAAQQQETAA